MRHSFIVTTYNIDSYITRCLDSLRPCTRPGDEIIVVDDGSTDGTAERVEALLAVGGFGPEVTLRPILLGANTIGGVGIPGNIGMSAAEGEAVFFVDGDDWLEPDGFLACRRAFESSGADILLGNYMEYDEQAGQSRPPADARRWSGLAAAQDATARQRFALALIAVPWRKFYRRSFLQEHRLKFPEGNFFFEDNPFHWEVCQKAGSIVFLDRILCQHRINRPGQTMASTGQELGAFFTHYETIRSRLPAGDAGLQGAALDWLINNMAWHVTRLHPEARWPYANRAAEVLASCPADLWAGARQRFLTTSIGGMAEALRRGEIAAVVSAWNSDHLRRQISDLGNRLTTLQASVTTLQNDGKTQGARLDGLRQIAEFSALKALARGCALDDQPDDQTETPA